MKSRSSNFIAFDLGSSKIAALATNIDNRGEVEIHAQSIRSSEGIKSGMIINMESAETSIVGMVYDLEQDCNKSIRKVVVSLSGSHVKSYYITQSMTLNNQTITQFHVSKLIQKALDEFGVVNREIIHYFPIEFRINDSQIVDNPIDLYANKLSCQLHIIAASSSMIMNLVKCFSKCHVEISNIILAIYSSALATMTDSEMELGSTIIDMGASTTSYAVFSKGKIIYSNAIEIGGNDITLSIAKSLSISIKEAEKLKILYGNTSSQLVIKDIIIELEDKSRTITVIEISRIISPIIEDIFNKIQKQCDAMSLNNLSAQQVVITGGAAALEGIKHCASNIFRKQIRIAKHTSLEGFIENYNPLSHSTLIGMIKFKIDSIQKKYHKDYWSSDAGFFKRIFLWIKNNI